MTTEFKSKEEMMTAAKGRGASGILMLILETVIDIRDSITGKARPSKRMPRSSLLKGNNEK